MESIRKEVAEAQIQVISGHLPGVNDENHRRTSVSIVSAPAETRNRTPTEYKSVMYHYTKTLGLPEMKSVV
jgi:hypothetical protein